MYVLWIMSAYLLMFIVRTVMGPSVWDRLLGMCLVTTKLTVIIILFASIYNTAYLLDFALIYTLFGFIGVIFISSFILKRTKGRK